MTTTRFLPLTATFEMSGDARRLLPELRPVPQGGCASLEGWALAQR